MGAQLVLYFRPVHWKAPSFLGVCRSSCPFSRWRDGPARVEGHYPEALDLEPAGNLLSGRDLELGRGCGDIWGTKPRTWDRCNPELINHLGSQAVGLPDKERI